MKRILIPISALFALFMCQLSFASNGGLFFNVSARGNPDNVSLTLCLDGNGSLSCQNYTVNALNLSITTTIPNHTYPSVGITVNTPGYAIANLGIDCVPNNVGYCIFSANDKTPISITINSSSSSNTYTIGGTISDLTTSGLVLQNNGDNNLSVSSGATSFQFSKLVASGGGYNVTVLNQPTGLNCIVSHGSGSNVTADVTNVTVTCSTETPTTLSVPSTGTIPVNGGSGSIIVTNTGSTTAYNVSVTLPGGWTGVTQDSSNCASIAPNGGTCTLSFTSTTPYIAQSNISVTGDNITSPPTTALAFTANGYLIWEVSGTTVQVIDTTDQSEPWGGYGTTIAGAESLTDGPDNTSAIVTGLGTGSSYAAKGCYESTNGGASVGTWYLPAICQMGGASQGAGCSSGLANIDTNLVQLGFGGLAGNYWSSTDASVSLPYYAWYQSFASGGGSQQAPNVKISSEKVRCSQALTL